MDRKMASIQKILALEPIEGADKIERATVLGWQVVVKKDEFKVGDFCVYCEVDSLIPFMPWSEFLFKNGREGTFRLKTIRLRGQVSQGLILPLTVFNYMAEDIIKAGMSLGKTCFIDFSIDADVSDLLGIKKYEPEIPAQLQGICKSTFPSWIPKTDETRIQSVPNVLDRQRGAVVYLTEKVDGCSMTVYIRDGEFGVCSRNMDLKETEGNTYWAVARKLGLEEKLRALGRNIALQGELYGASIQGNKYKINNEQRLAIFNVFDIDRSEYVDWPEVLKTVQELGLETVPFICQMVLQFNDVKEAVAFTNRKSALNPETPIEGVVIRPVREERDPVLGRFSFKVINPEFLLKYGE